MTSEEAQVLVGAMNRMEIILLRIANGENRYDNWDLFELAALIADGLIEPVVEARTLHITTRGLTKLRALEAK